MPFEVAICGVVAFIMFTLNGPLQNGGGSKGGGSSKGGKGITDEQLIQMGRDRGLFK